MEIDHFAEVVLVCPAATPLTESGVAYILLPKLRMPSGCAVELCDGLLCLGGRDGYLTRLFLSEPIPSRCANWTVHCVLGRIWHTWSWQGVPLGLRPAEILANHLRALR
jgi:hypothetical protein